MYAHCRKAKVMAFVNRILECLRVLKSFFFCFGTIKVTIWRSKAWGLTWNFLARSLWEEKNIFFSNRKMFNIEKMSNFFFNLKLRTVSSWCTYCTLSKFIFLLAILIKFLDSERFTCTNFWRKMKIHKFFATFSCKTRVCIRIITTRGRNISCKKKGKVTYENEGAIKWKCDCELRTRTGLNP